MTAESITGALTSATGAWFALAVHIAGVLGCVAYGIGQAHLAWYLWRRPPRGAPPMLPPDDELPFVTVQVPMYNERYVAAAVIDACAQLDWPRHRLELQLLDDSVDETKAIVDERAAYWRSHGVDVTVVRRTVRTGYKAGALAHAATSARGEFHALFDADFRPERDFLRRTMGWFADERVGAVQARWGHLNREWSWLTRAQSVVIDAFFVGEQEARDRAGFFVRFNGSAGIWRARAIASSGGWLADTLAEDLDLAYRAQLGGWRIVFTRDVVAPAELPVTVHDYKVQQTRWARGRGQVIRKLLPAVWRAPIPRLVKAHAMFDLLNIVVAPAVLLLLIGSAWLVLALDAQPAARPLARWVGLAQLPTNIGILPLYLVFALRPYARTLWAFAGEALRCVPPFFALIMGVNAVLFTQVIAGLRGGVAPFHRTSKYNVDAGRGGWRSKLYKPTEISGVTWLEGALAAAGAASLIVDVTMGAWFWIPFHLVTIWGFGALFTLSLVRR